MSEFPSTPRNPRKHFLKCVDCGCQTLPQNASTERAWAAAASLYIRDRVNDGALCFNCANKRRGLLGQPLDKEAVTRPEDAVSECEAKLKAVRINDQEYCWEIGTLESVLAKWRDECAPQNLKKWDTRWLIVAVNNNVVPAAMHATTSISDGDDIVIALGAIAGG